MITVREITPHVEVESTGHNCPICDQFVYNLGAYHETQLCNICVMDLVDDKGNPISLSASEKWWNKFEATVLADKTHHDHPKSFIKKGESYIECYIKRIEGTNAVIVVKV